MTRNLETIVDDVFFEELSKFKWSIHSCGYAVRNTRIKGKSITILMHRLITGAPSGFLVDHINRNKLDNRRENLRVCTQQENQFNVPPSNIETRTSKYKGVCWSAKRKKWVVQIGKIYKRFDNEEDAALFYNNKALELHGEFAYINDLERQVI